MLKTGPLTMFKEAKHWKTDIPSGLVVFLVAIPLCLGIALASGSSAMSGIIAGIVGGLVVTLFSNSSLGVSASYSLPDNCRRRRKPTSALRQERR